MKFSSVSFLAAVFSSPLSTPLFGGSSSVVVVSASAIVEAVKKESGREKREGKGRFLGAFSKADSLRETLLERKNKKPRKVRHWKPNEVEEADFNSSTALGRLNSTTSLLGRLGIEPSRTKVESFAADISGGIPCTKRNGEADVKCDGYYACDGINPDHVGCGSCNGQAACLFATGTVIGEESCNEFGACYKTSGAEIEDQSCNGVGACGLSPGIVVEEGSCNKSYEDDYAMCGLASGAHIGKESCLGHYGEVMLKISIVALINSLCVNISILPRFINHHSKLAPSGMDPKLAKVVVRAMNPVMLPFIMTRRRKDDTVMVQGATLAMDLAIIPGVVAPFGALLATTPAILFVPAILVGEQFMMVPVVALTAVIITLHAFFMRGTVHDNSCNGVIACDSTYGRIGKDSCNEYEACYHSSTFIGDKSCNGNSTCFGVNGYEIGSCACNTDFECLCVSEEGEEGYTCDNSDGVFTDAQKSTCKRSAKARKGREGDRGSASANIFSPDD
eukprot:g5282.t1 g5282   contig2:156776-159955(+)